MRLTSFGSYRFRPSKITGLLRVDLIIAKSGLRNSFHSATMIASPNIGNFHIRKSFKFESSSLGSMIAMIKTWLVVILGPVSGSDIFKWAINWVLFRVGNYPVLSSLLLQSPRSLPNGFHNAVCNVPVDGINYFPTHAARLSASPRWRCGMRSACSNRCMRVKFSYAPSLPTGSRSSVSSAACACSGRYRRLIAECRFAVQWSTPELWGWRRLSRGCRFFGRRACV
jgi:hypothetical protein